MRGTRGATRSKGQRLLYPPPSLDLRFAETKSLTDWISGQNLITFSRASSGTFTDSAGILRNAAVNSIRNNTMQGAVAGTPGTVPTNWAVTGTADGLTRTVVGTGTENGITYIDIRFSGTTTAASFNTIAPEIIGQVAAVSGQTWTHTMYVSLVGGSTANITSVQIGINEYSSVPAFLAGNRTTFAPTSGALNTRRQTHTRTLTNASTVSVHPYMLFEYGNGAAIDITLRIGLPQLELGSSATEIIRTTGTINSAPRFDHDPLTGESLGLLVEEQRTNLLLRSEEFDNASWAKLNSVTITANAIAAPNGTITADKIVEPASSAGKPVVQLVNLAASTTYTASVYFKAAERPTILFHVRKSDYSTRFGGFFNTSTNTFTAETASGGVLDSFVFRNIGNGWYQCSITGNIGANTAGIVTIYMANSSNNFAYTGDGTSGFYLWGAQLEAGAFPTSYIPTTTATATRSADLASITGSNFGTFRTNLLLRSEEFDNASWAKNQCSVTLNDHAAPNGTLTADRITATGNDAFVQQYPITGAALGATLTASIWVKGTGSTIGKTAFIAVTTNSGIGTETVFTVTANWQRVSVTRVTPAGDANGGVRVDWVNPSAIGDELYLWGAQLETGSTATAYIPTTTAAVTVFESSWYRQDEGTVFASPSTINAAYTSGVIWDIGAGGAFGSTAYCTWSGTQWGLNPNVSPLNLLSAITAPALSTNASALQSNNSVISASGLIAGVDSSCSMPSNPTTLSIGRAGWTSGNFFNGTIRRLTYWPQRLPNNTLVAITR